MLHTVERFTCPLTYTICSIKQFSSMSFVSRAHPPLRGRRGSRQRICLHAWPGARSSCGGIPSAGSVSSAVIRPRRRLLPRGRRRRLQRGFLKSRLIRAYRLRRLLLLLLLLLLHLHHFPISCHHRHRLHHHDLIFGLAKLMMGHAVLLISRKREPFIMKRDTTTCCHRLKASRSKTQDS